MNASLLLYNVGIRLYGFAARVLSLFKPKAKLFVQGRKKIFKKIEAEIKQDLRPKVWFHAASLGEFEQARPLIESFNSHWNEYAIVLSFFSPSGFEIRKNYPGADYIFYLPLDNKRNATKWLEILNPRAIFFAKYDFWYHYLHQAWRRKIPLFVFSASFRPNQIFFKKTGVLQRKMLPFFTHIFVQDPQSKQLLQSIQIEHCSIAGDTRIDRVLKMKEDAPRIDFIKHFKAEKKLLIGGSVWQADWDLILESYEQIKKEYRVVLAPHEIDEHTLQKIESKAQALNISTTRFSHKKTDAFQYDILILDTIGMLAASYQYAEAAFVGGGFGRNGLHNILEPAVFGLPVFFGPNHHKFIEAKQLMVLQAAFAIHTKEELIERVLRSDILSKAEMGAAQYFAQNRGATDRIINYLILEKCLSSNP